MAESNRTGYGIGGGGTISGILNFDPIDNDTKINHDAYDVYVNGEYLGKKTLLNGGESVGDIDSFLHSRGFTKFTAELKGDHYEIQVDDDKMEDVINNLHVYLNIR